eukprot:scaffold8570_cov111-Isochrysis_galbana.AAC.7
MSLSFCCVGPRPRRSASVRCVARRAAATVTTVGVTVTSSESSHRVCRQLHSIVAWATRNTSARAPSAGSAAAAASASPVCSFLLSASALARVP